VRIHCRELMRALLCLLIVAGCSSRQQLRVSLDAEDEFALAKKAFDERQWDRAAEGFKRLMFDHPESGLVDDAQFYLAETYLAQEEYELAIVEYRQLSRNHPRSEYADDADFSIGLAYYRRSPAFDLDQQFTEQAIEAFNVFLVRHPRSPLVAEAESKRKELRERLARKEYENGLLYLRLGHIESAQIYFEIVRDQYRDTEWRARAEKKLLEIASDSVSSSDRPAAGWSEVLDISEPRTNSYTSRNNARSIGGDWTGTVHIVWQEAREAGDIVLYREWDGVEWSESRRLSDEEERALSPALAVDVANSVHVVWERDMGDRDALAYRMRGAGGWSEVEVIAEGGSRAWYPAIDAGLDGAIHVVWMDDRSGNFEIWHRRHDAGGWAEPVQVSHSPGISAMPSVAVGPDGRVHAVWQEEMVEEGGESVQYASGDGLNWSEPLRLSSGEGGLHPSLAVTGDGTVIAVWQEGEGPTSIVQYRALAGGAWGPVVQLSLEDETASTPTVAAGRESIVVAWARRRDDDRSLAWRSRGGDEWQEPIVASEGTTPTHPSVWISPEGRVHLAWCDVDGGTWRVRYRSRK
jgi:outer membrane protein assembly factor BamD